MELKKLITREVITVKKTTPVFEAAKLMRKHHIGDVVVVDKSASIPIGILTDRDIVMATIALKIPYENLSVGDIMSDKIITLHEDAEIHQVITIMKTNGVKRLPVVGADKTLVGIISREDVLKYLGNEFSLIGDTYTHQRLKEKARRPNIH